MRGYDPRTNRASQMTTPSAVTQRLVRVEEVGTKLVHCIDNNGQLYTLRHQISRTRVRPRVGEFWLIDQSYTGAWTFASFVEDTDPVAVTGPVPTGPLVGLVQILSELGLIDDQTTDGGDPPELTGVLKTGSWEAGLSAGLSAMGLADDTGVTYGTAREFPNGSGATVANMRLVPSTHVSSERASIEFGSNWVLGMDPAADGTTADKFFIGYSGTILVTADSVGNVTGSTITVTDAATSYVGFVRGGVQSPRIEFVDDAVYSHSAKTSLDTVGSGWTQRVGTWTANSTLTYVSTSGGAANIFTKTTGTDHDIRVTISADANKGKGIVLRWADASNYIYVVNTATGWNVIQRLAGTETTLGSIVSASGAGTIIRARIAGTALTVWVNEALAGRYTISGSLTGANAGLYATSSSTGSSNGFNNVVIIEANVSSSLDLALQKSAADVLSMAFGGNMTIDFSETGITGSAFALKSWSPTIRQNGTSISRTINTGVYTVLFGQIGFGVLSATFTASSGAAGDITVDTPTTLANANYIFGGGFYFDAGNTRLLIAVTPSSTTQMAFSGDNLGANFGHSFTIASTDYMHFFCAWRL